MIFLKGAKFQNKRKLCSTLANTIHAHKKVVFGSINPATPKSGCHLTSQHRFVNQQTRDETRQIHQLEDFIFILTSVQRNIKTLERRIFYQSS